VLICTIRVIRVLMFLPNKKAFFSDEILQV